MRETPGRWQWSLSVVTYHGPGFGHCIEVITHRKGADPVITEGGRWNSLGIPEPVLAGLTSTVQAALTHHFVTRYGVQGELPVKWAGEPDPF